jgi:hypothetical protein
VKALRVTWIIECSDCDAEISRHDTIEAARLAGEAHDTAKTHASTIYYQPDAGSADGPTR